MRTTHTVSNKQINVGTLSTLGLYASLFMEENTTSTKTSPFWTRKVRKLFLGTDRTVDFSSSPSFRFHLLLLFFLPHWLRFFSGWTGGQTETGGTVKVLADLYDKRQYLKYMETNKNNSEILLR